ncbi:hypothetical protein M9458_000585, partial [Cirrhinus mrigala]
HVHGGIKVPPLVLEEAPLCSFPAGCVELYELGIDAGEEERQPDGYCSECSDGPAPSEVRPVMPSRRDAERGRRVSFDAPEEDPMSIAASEEGITPDEVEESAEQLPPVAAAQSEADAELAAMLLRAAKSIGQPRPAPVPFFLEVHEELTKTWKAPYSARTCPGSSLLTTLDDGAARGYVDVPQVECAVAVHLCPQNAATWRNHPRLPSKACKISSALAAKAYSAAGQAASALHAMAILQVHQAQALKQLHEGRPDKRVMQELRTATDFALRATKVTVRHLWLNLAQMADADKVRFLDAPISQDGLFGDTFSAVQKQTEAIKHILPRRESTKLPAAKPSSARRRGRPPAASTPAPPPREQPARQRSGPETGDLEMGEIVLRGTSTSAPLPPGEGRGLVSLLPPLTPLTFLRLGLGWFFFRKTKHLGDR